MRKLYGVLLIALFTISSAWPQEHPSPPDQKKGFSAWVRKKYLHTSSTIKRQFQDKQKRRWWISSSIIGLASFLSWRFGAFHKIWERKKEKAGTVEGDQPPKDVRDRLRAQPDRVQAARRALVKNGRASRAPHDDTDRPANREAFQAAMKIAEKLGKPPDKGTEDGTSNLVRFDGEQPSPSRAPGLSEEGTTQIRGDQETAEEEKDSFAPGGSIIIHDDAPAGDEGSYHPPKGFIMGAEGIRADLEAREVHGPRAKLARTDSSVIPELFEIAKIIQKYRTQGFSINTSKQKALEDLHQGRNFSTADRESLAEAVRKGGATIEKRGTAQERFAEGAAQHDLKQAVDALTDGASFREEDIFETLFEVAKDYENLSQEDKMAFDCLVFQAQIPLEACINLVHRLTMKRIHIEGHKPISLNIFEPPAPSSAPATATRGIRLNRGNLRKLL